jgi:hypothetical protein
MPNNWKITKLADLAVDSIFLIDGPLDYSRVLRALERLAGLVDSADDVDWFDGADGMASLDNLLVGAYWYCVDYHGGQWSDEYRLQCAIGEFYSPGICGLDRNSSEFEVYVGLAVLAGHGEWDDISNNYDEED